MRFLVLLAASFLVMSSSFATHLNELSAGTFWGHSVNDHKDYQLFVTEMPGREGSFIGVMIKEGLTKEAVGVAYLIDKFAENKYGMIPLVATTYGTVAPNHPDPSLSLSIVPFKNYHKIKIVSNNSDQNKQGFLDSIEFKLIDRSSADYIAPIFSGTFKYKNHRATVSEMINNESLLNTDLPNLSGEFTLRQIRPNLHIILKHKMTQSGLEITDEPAALAVFVEDNFIFHRHFLVLINLQDNTLTYMLKM